MILKFKRYEEMKSGRDHFFHAAINQDNDLWGIQRVYVQGLGEVASINAPLPAGTIVVTVTVEQVAGMNLKETIVVWRAYEDKLYAYSRSNDKIEDKPGNRQSFIYHDPSRWQGYIEMSAQHNYW